MSQAIPMDHVFEKPAWKTIVNWVASILIAFLFLSSGVWKISDPFGWSVMLHQLRVPQAVSMPFTVLLGVLETLTGLLFLIPGYRRIAAGLGIALLVAFMIYMGVNYTALHGADCSCFPFVKRAVNPAFFAEDGAMIVLALIAGLWAGTQAKLRGAFFATGIITVFAFVSFGVAASRQTGAKAPDTLTVDGKPYPINTGDVFIYFYDPECTHCLDAGERMSKLDWGNTKFVGQPVVNPQFAPFFMQRSGLKGVTASNFDLLKKAFPYKATPAAVAIHNGRQAAMLNQFDGNEPLATIRKLGFAR